MDKTSNHVWVSFRNRTNASNERVCQYCGMIGLADNLPDTECQPITNKIENEIYRKQVLDRRQNALDTMQLYPYFDLVVVGLFQESIGIRVSIPMSKNDGGVPKNLIRIASAISMFEAISDILIMDSDTGEILITAGFDHHLKEFFLRLNGVLFASTLEKEFTRFSEAYHRCPKAMDVINLLLTMAGFADVKKDK